VTLRVIDDGPGFDAFIFDRLGDPFVTTRPGYDVTAGATEAAGHEGMGLGLFIAKTLLERSGATVTLSNRQAPEHGAEVKLLWPRNSIDVENIAPKALDPKPAQRQ
jgi:two-component system, sensor histidine kinase RegB